MPVNCPFDDEVETVTRMCDAPFEYALQPRGMTALLDAAGTEIVRTGQDLAALPEEERPARVLLVVVTDGQENSSREYTLEQVRSMLAMQRQEYGWRVRFLGAADAAWQGEILGVGTTRFANSPAGHQAVFHAMSRSMAAYRDARVGQALQMPGRDRDGMTRTVGAAPFPHSELGRVPGVLEVRQLAEPLVWPRVSARLGIARCAERRTWRTPSVRSLGVRPNGRVEPRRPPGHHESAAQTGASRCAGALPRKRPRLCAPGPIGRGAGSVWCRRGASPSVVSRLPFHKVHRGSRPPLSSREASYAA